MPRPNCFAFLSERCHELPSVQFSSKSSLICCTAGVSEKKLNSFEYMQNRLNASAYSMLIFTRVCLCLCTPQADVANRTSGSVSGREVARTAAPSQHRVPVSLFVQTNRLEPGRCKAPGTHFSACAFAVGSACHRSIDPQCSVRTRPDGLDESKRGLGHHWRGRSESHRTEGKESRGHRTAGVIGTPSESISRQPEGASGLVSSLTASASAPSSSSSSSCGCGCCCRPSARTRTERGRGDEAG